MHIRIAACSVASLVVASAFAQGVYTDGYADVVYNKLTGVSTFEVLRAGYKIGPHDLHLFVRNEAYDTHGSDLPFNYAGRGAIAGLGYRLWLAKDTYATATYGQVLSGQDNGQRDFRVGIAGFRQFSKPTLEKDDIVTDVYGDTFYVDRAKDTYFDLRVRLGRVVDVTDAGHTWVYSVLQALASSRGTNGTENRVEAGIGGGYVFAKHFSLNLELREGYSFRGQISKKTYFNPMVTLSSSW